MVALICSLVIITVFVCYNKQPDKVMIKRRKEQLAESSDVRIKLSNGLKYGFACMKHPYNSI